MPILKYNIHYTNIITIQDTILIVKILITSIKTKKFIINMPDIKVTRIYNTINILLKYNWYLDLINNKVAIDLELQSIKKYWKPVAQILDEHSYL